MSHIRPLVTKSQQDKKKKRNAITISLIFLALLIISTASYAFMTGVDSGNTNSVINESSNIHDLGNQWGVDVGGKTFVLSNPPSAVKSVPINMTFSILDVSGNSVYIASKNGAIAQEVASVLSTYTSRVQLACYGACEENLPEKNCNDTLIVWVDSTENKVYQRDKCVFIQGDLRAADAFIYNILGM